MSTADLPSLRTKLTARVANAGDVSLLVDLMEAFYAEANYPLDRPWAARSFAALLANDALGAAWVIFDAAAVAGYVVLTVRFSMEHGGLMAHIDDLYVRPSFRRRGAGTIALAALFDDCRRRGALAACVEVGEHNSAADALYRRFGLARGTDGRIALTARLNDPTPHGRIVPRRSE